MKNSTSFRFSTLFLMASEKNRASFLEESGREATAPEYAAYLYAQRMSREEKLTLIPGNVACTGEALDGSSATYRVSAMTSRKTAGAHRLMGQKSFTITREEAEAVETFLRS